MDCEHQHQPFKSFPRRSQTLRNDRCQNILYKAVFEHFKEVKLIAALLLASKSFQNSSFGANFILNFVLDENSIHLIDSVLSPSSCFSLQFVPSIRVKQSWNDVEKADRAVFNFVGELVKTKYLHLSLRSLTLHCVANGVLSLFFWKFGRTWTHLHDLNLESCNLNDSVLETISKKAVQLRALNLSENSRITNSGLQHLSKLSGITSLNLSRCDKITDAGLENIAKISGVTALNLSNCVQITASCLVYLSNLSGMRSLNFANCWRLHDAGLEHLPKFSSITSLDLSNCGSVSASGLVHVAKLSGMRSLNLANCWRIDDAGFEHIAKLAGITSLNLDGCSHITDVCLQHISKLSCLTSLNLHACEMITDAGLEHLSKIAGITYLNLGGCHKITDDATMKFKMAVPKCKIDGLR